MLFLAACTPEPLDAAILPKTDGPVDATSRDWSTGVRRVSSSTGAFADHGYEVVVYELDSADPAYALDLETPEGEDPRFLVAWPATDDPTTERPVTMFLHGGATDLDSEADPDGEEDRCTRAWANTQANRVINGSPFSLLAAEAGHILVAPLNAYCDGWAGLGPDDPADTMHAGERLAESAIGYVLWGQSRHGVDTSLVTLAGSSLGSIGMSWTLLRVPEIDQVLFDSGVGDFVRYSTDEGYSDFDYDTRVARGEHTMGGPAFDDEARTIPSAWYDRYVEHSFELLVEDGRIALPTFQLYNDQDPLCPGEANRELTAALEAAYDAGSGVVRGYDDVGPRYVAHDNDHTDPAHGQLTNTRPLYGAWGASRFAQGHHVVFVEAEDDDPRRTGAVFSGGADDGWLSKASGRQATAADGAGALFRVTIPSDVPVGAEVTVAFFLEMSDAASPAVPGAVVTLREGTFTRAQSRIRITDADFDVDDYASHRAALEAATVSATRGATGTMTAELYVTGTATVRADVAVVSWPAG